MWHLHMFTDFGGPFYIELGGAGGNLGPVGSGEPSGEADSNEQTEWKGEGGNQVSSKHDYLYSKQFTQFSHDRLRSEMEVFLPKPYETWSFEDGNYGPTKEEYESLGIDLDAWYAAHK